MNTLMDLAELIEACVNSEDEIDRTYLLEAVVEDLRALAGNGAATAVAYPFENPVS